MARRSGVRERARTRVAPRWATLCTLLARLERLHETVCRLDVYTAQPRYVKTAHARRHLQGLYDQSVRQLTARIDTHETQLQVEILHAALRRALALPAEIPLTLEQVRSARTRSQWIPEKSSEVMTWETNVFAEEDSSPNGKSMLITNVSRFSHLR